MAQVDFDSIGVVMADMALSLTGADGGEFAVHSRGSTSEALAHIIEQEEGIEFGKISFVPGAEVRATALVRADGAIMLGDKVGSIHRIGAVAQGSGACNGWTFWHVETKNGLKLIDEMRADGELSKGVKLPNGASIRDPTVPVKLIPAPDMDAGPTPFEVISAAVTPAFMSFAPRP